MTITVYGDPAPQGSKSFKGISKRGKAIMVESSKAVKPWREAVKFAALEVRKAEGHSKDEMNGVRFIGPVSVAVTFYHDKPQGKPKWMNFVAVKPDIDKLLRSTFDALSDAGVWKDDSRVVEVSASKRYAEGRAPGAVITVERITG